MVQRLEPESGGAGLREARAGDQSGALQDLQMPRDGRRADREGLRELGDGRLSLGEPVEDGAPRRVRQRREGEAELVVRHRSLITIRLINRLHNSAAQTLGERGDAVSATVLYMSMSLDGFIAGPNEGPGNGLGDGGQRLHEWAMPDGAVDLEAVRS